MVQKTLLVGNTIDVGVERFKIPELIFQPHLLPSLGLGDDAPELKMADGSPLRGLPSLILENINKCDVDVRKDLFGGMLLAGGGSLFGSLRERLEADLHDAAPTNVRVKARPIVHLRRHACEAAFTRPVFFSQSVHRMYTYRRHACA